MRIVHVSDCYAPRVGGIESQVQDLATQQAAAGHAVHVLTATPAEEGSARNRYRASTTDAPGLRVHRLASRVTFGVPVLPRGRAMIGRALEILRPDVVHVHAGVVSPFAYDGARAARQMDMPLAITWHCMLDGVEGALGLGSKLTGWNTAPFAPSAVSSVAAERVAEALGRPDVTVVPNGLDLAPWRRAAAAPEPSQWPGTLRVVATQRLAPRKRALAMVRIVADAAQALADDGGPRVQLTVAGAGPAEPSLRAEIASRGLTGAFRLLGRVPREALPTLYRGQDVFLSATTLEAFGIAGLEARAAGLVVMGRSGTGMSEFVTSGASGFLETDDAALTRRLVDLARQPGLVARIRAHNRDTPPSFAWADVLGAADALYERARSEAGLQQGDLPSP